MLLLLLFLLLSLLCLLWLLLLLLPPPSGLAATMAVTPASALAVTMVVPAPASESKHLQADGRWLERALLASLDAARGGGEARAVKLLEGGDEGVPASGGTSGGYPTPNYTHATTVPPGAGTRAEEARRWVADEERGTEGALRAWMGAEGGRLNVSGQIKSKFMMFVPKATKRNAKGGVEHLREHVAVAQGEGENGENGGVGGGVGSGSGDGVGVRDGAREDGAGGEGSGGASSDEREKRLREEFVAVEAAANASTAAYNVSQAAIEAVRKVVNASAVVNLSATLDGLVAGATSAATNASLLAAAAAALRPVAANISEWDVNTTVAHYSDLGVGEEEEEEVEEAEAEMAADGVTDVEKVKVEETVEETDEDEVEDEEEDDVQEMEKEGEVDEDPGTEIMGADDDAEAPACCASSKCCFNVTEAQNLLARSVDTYAADKTGRPDYAVRSAGGRIVDVQREEWPARECKDGVTRGADGTDVACELEGWYGRTTQWLQGATQPLITRMDPGWRSTSASGAELAIDAAEDAIGQCFAFPGQRVNVTVSATDHTLLE